MAYNRYYRRRSHSSSYYGWSAHRTPAPSESRRLTSVTGGIDKDIEKYFLNLDLSRRSVVLEAYRKEYGDAAYEYACKAFQEWKSGMTSMSGQTRKRLLNLVPSVLDADSRFLLVKKLRAANFSVIHKSIHCTIDQWRERTIPELKSIIEASATFEMPREVRGLIDWLADGDVIASQKLLAAAEREEALVRLRHLNNEIERISHALSQSGGKGTATHEIRIPQGVIRLHFNTPSFSSVKKSSSSGSCLVVLLLPIAIIIAMICS